MLSISIPMKGAGKGDYYLRLAQEDYYFNNGEPSGQWHGKGAEKLGLTGRISPEVLRRVLEGYSPDGQKGLVQNAGDEDRQSAWDLTYNPPKSFGVLWGMSPPTWRSSLEAIHREAFHEALANLQEETAFTRRGKAGAIKERAEFIFATFRHSTSREQDPQPHYHTLLINTCVRDDGTTGTVWSMEFFHAKKQSGAVYAEALARRLEQRLGLSIEPEETGFHITGVPRELCDHFSKRSKQIKAFMAEHGTSGAVAAKKAALATRPKKKKVNAEDLLARWRDAGRQFGWSEKQAEALLQKSQANLQQKTLKSESQEVGQHHSKTTEPLESAKPIQPRTEQKKEAELKPVNQSPELLSPSVKEAEQSRTEDRTDTKSKTSKRRIKTRSAGSKRQRTKQSRRKRDSADEDTSQRDPRRYRNRRSKMVRWEWEPLFPKAPQWSPFQQWKLPRIVIGQKPHSKWGKIGWRKDLWLVEVRVQQRRLFSNAPDWSFASAWSLPSLRIVPPPPMLRPKKRESHKEQKSFSHAH